VQQGCYQDNLEGVLAEVRRTIDRWFFWVSVTGLIYVEPKHHSLSLMDLADMIGRLRVVCDRSFQGVITFEFSRCCLDGQQWNQAEKQLQDFALSIEATMVSYRGLHEPAAWFILYRYAPERTAEQPAGPGSDAHRRGSSPVQWCVQPPSPGLSTTR
jgi:hypothetical protein